VRFTAPAKSPRARGDDATTQTASTAVSGFSTVPNPFRAALLVKVLGPVSDAMNPSLIVTDDGERDQKAGRGHEFSGDG